MYKKEAPKTIHVVAAEVRQQLRSLQTMCELRPDFITAERVASMCSEAEAQMDEVCARLVLVRSAMQGE